LCLSRIYNITSPSFFMTLSDLVSLSVILGYLAAFFLKIAGLSHCRQRTG
jgi:hypothetical protein